MGSGLALAGLGTWMCWWYAPLLRGLNGVHPHWLGPSWLAAGVGLLLAAWASSAASYGVRSVLWICVADAAVVLVGCLAVGLRLRGVADRC